MLLNLKGVVARMRQSQNEQGQGLVEYALILVLVAIVVIAVLMVLGPVVGNVFSEVKCNLDRTCGSTASSQPGSPTPTPDPYANHWGPERHQAPQIAINDFCYQTAPGTNYKLYVHPDGTWHKAAGTATSSSDPQASTTGGVYTQVGTGTCP